MEKTVNITNFIGVYDNYILPNDCDSAIKLYEEENKFNNTINRIDGEKSPTLLKQDQQYFATRRNLNFWWDSLKPMILNFDMAWKHYIKNTGVEDLYGDKLHLTEVKLQKTLPTEGYHVWHIEHGPGYENKTRAFVYSIYLNDVEEGGETEFLHFSKRVKPKKGRIVIWPAGFPYLHRGNPPLSGEKYILTSWILVN
mgnify:CR=1 FL=1